MQEKSEHYLNLHDGGFDEKCGRVWCPATTKTRPSPTHFPPRRGRSTKRAASTAVPSPGCSITAFGVVANFTAGDNEATTTDMTVSFLRGVDYGMEVYTVYIVKAGRSSSASGRS